MKIYIISTISVSTARDFKPIGSNFAGLVETAKLPGFGLSAGSNAVFS